MELQKNKKKIDSKQENLKQPIQGDTMEIKDGKCNSCEKEVNFLFPIVVTEELPTGGFAMVTKYYCIECYETLCEVAHDEMDEEKEEEDEKKEEEEEPY